MMNFKYNGTDYTYPASLAEITLKQRIEFDLIYGNSLQESIVELQKMEDDDLYKLAETKLTLQTACQALSFFTGIPLQEVLNKISVDTVTSIFDESLSYLLFYAEKDYKENREIEFNKDIWYLPDAILLPSSKITFNEFLTSKEIVRQIEQSKQSKYISLLYLCCVFLRRKDEKFDESFIEDDSERMQLMRSLPIHYALSVGHFFDTFNNYLSKHFAVFKKGKGVDMGAHFQRYGWVSFLSYVAESKVFDVSGSDSIDSAKNAQLYKVLVWSSEKREKEEAIASHYESLNKK